MALMRALKWMKHGIALAWSFSIWSDRATGAASMPPAASSSDHPSGDRHREALSAVGSWHRAPPLIDPSCAIARHWLPLQRGSASGWPRTLHHRAASARLEPGAPASFEWWLIDAHPASTRAIWALSPGCVGSGSPQLSVEQAPRRFDLERQVRRAMTLI